MIVAHDAREQSNRLELLVECVCFLRKSMSAGAKYSIAGVQASTAARSFQLPGILLHTLRCARSTCARFKHRLCRSGSLRSDAAKAGFGRISRPSSKHLRRSAGKRLLQRQQRH